MAGVLNLVFTSIGNFNLSFTILEVFIYTNTKNSNRNTELDNDFMSYSNEIVKPINGSNKVLFLDKQAGIYDFYIDFNGNA